MNVSQFERLIVTHGFPHTTLAVQHRMHPDVSRLVRPTYPVLEDAPSVAQHPPLRGLQQAPGRVLWVDHRRREGVDEAGRGAAKWSAAGAQQSKVRDQATGTKLQAGASTALQLHLQGRGSWCDRHHPCRAAQPTCFLDGAQLALPDTHLHSGKGGCHGTACHVTARLGSYSAPPACQVNMHEVDLVAAAVRYLLQQGYEPEQLVVLTPYLGQLLELQRALSASVAVSGVVQSLPRARTASSFHPSGQ